MWHLQAAQHPLLQSTHSGLEDEVLVASTEIDAAHIKCALWTDASRSRGAAEPALLIWNEGERLSDYLNVIRAVIDLPGLNFKSEAVAERISRSFIQLKKKILFERLAVWILHRQICRIENTEIVDAVLSLNHLILAERVSRMNFQIVRHHPVMGVVQS